MHDRSVPGLLARLPELPHKVVLVGEPRLGAFICTTPAFRALRAALPAAEIAIITAVGLRDVVSRSRHLDRLVAAPPFKLAARSFDARHMTIFFQELQKEYFDLAIQLQGYGLHSNPFLLMLGARVNSGFVGPGDIPALLDAALPVPQEGHQTDRFLALTTFLGAPPQGRETEFPLWPEDHAAAEALLGEAPRPLIGLHPAARHERRRWPPERFAAVGAALRQSYGGTIVILCEGKEQPVADLVARRVGGRCLNLAGRTSLPVLGAVINRLSVFVTNDTGPAHIAYALRTPAVTIFAASSPVSFWPPENGPFRAVLCDGRDPRLHEGACLEAIAVSTVLEAAREVMQ